MERKKSLSINLIAVLIIVFAFVSYYIFEYINYNYTIKKNYTELEKVQGNMYLDNFDNLLTNNIKSQERLMLDYAAWDDTYDNFYNPEWMKKEIVDWIGEYYSLTNVLVVNKELSPLYYYEKSDNNFISKVSDLISRSDNNQGSNFIKIKNVIYIISFAEIVPERENFDKVGYLILVTELDNNFKENYSNILGHKLEIESWKSSDFELTDSEMIIRLPIKNIHGQVIGKFAITDSRDIYNLLSKYETSYKFLQLILLIITLTITYWIVSKYITKPFKALENDISNLDTNRYNYLEEKYSTSEINKLVRTFNSLIYRLLYIENQNEKLLSANKMDFLTKLYNRKHFSHYINTSKEATLSFIFIDIDNFKSINDYHGHEKGDLILKEIGKIIQLHNQGKYKGFRYGGEEIVIVYNDTKDIAYNVAENLRKIIIRNDTIQHYSIDKPITISCGISNYPEDTNSVEEAVNYADIAMYNAKKNGKNRTHLYTNNQVHSKEHLEMEFNLDYIIAISNAIDSKIPFKENHAKFVSDYSFLVGKKLGFRDNILKELRIGGYIHDIGKISISDSIFLKKTRLSDEELDTVTSHPSLGFEIISKATNSQVILSCIKEHHERIDGLGFPNKLKGEEISIYGRIISVVNAYHTMISDLPYKKALSHHEAIEELIDNKGTQFDSTVVDIFIGLMD
ncbi:MAG: diguanylate cyclase [Firmicutes bacterium]|jgi:diguanylate cyclase (GGDEF)-like protein|nr:diguanylate cyclase [Bacillota bacterium]